MAILPASATTGTAEVAFDDGLVETLTSRLTQLTQKHPLAVIPASEVRARNITTVDAARAEFGVNLGLLIRVQHATGQERVNYSLVDARSHQELRGGTITAANSDPFALQDRVSESVAQALELQLQPQEKRALEVHGTTEPAAYDFYLQGRGYLQDYGQLEKIESAVTVFGRALEKDPAFAAAYAGLGEAYWRKYEQTHDSEWVKKASEACQQATQRDEQLAEGHTCLGLVYQGTGKYEQASQEYGKAATIEPTLDAAQSGLAGTYEKLNRTDDAERAYRAAVALRPNYWAGYNRMGAFYFRHGKMEDAAQMFSQVVSLAPDSFIGYSNLGIVRVTEGRYPEAIPLLERSLAIRETGDAKSNLATAYFQSKRYAEAAKIYEGAAAIDPKNYEVWGNLGDAYYWAPGLRERAPQAYRKAVQLAEAKRKVNARDANLLSYLASYYAMLGSRKPAEERIAEALRLAPRDAEVLFYSAVVHEQTGETNKVLDALERSVAAGYSRETIQDTPNFSRLQENPRFQRLISNTKAQEGKNP